MLSKASKQLFTKEHPTIVKQHYPLINYSCSMQEQILALLWVYLEEKNGITDYKSLMNFNIQTTAALLMENWLEEMEIKLLKIQ